MKVMKINTVNAFLLLFCVLASAAVYADNSTPKLHPLEKACVEYKVEGQMMNGSTIRCHRDFAYEQYEITDTTIGFGGFKQSQKQHNITIGKTIYAINLATNSATKTQNPMYDQMVASLKKTSPEKMGEQFTRSMGFTPTGQKKTIAGAECQVYQSQGLGSMCMTSKGLMLEQSVMGNVTRAVKVSVGDGGDDSQYQLYKKVKVTEGPDLSKGIPGMFR